MPGTPKDQDINDWLAAQAYNEAKQPAPPALGEPPRECCGPGGHLVNCDCPNPPEAK